MFNITLCRVCLASNTRMHHIGDTLYQEIFEKLATKLQTTDRRPETLCYLCYSQLQKCRRFMVMSRKAEDILTQFALSGIELTEDTVSILDRKFVRKFSWTPLQVMSSIELDQAPMKVEIKTESPDNEEIVKERETGISCKVPDESQETFTEGCETLAERQEIPVKVEPISDSEERENQWAEKPEILESTERTAMRHEILTVKREPMNEDTESIIVKQEAIKQEIEFEEDEYEIEVSSPNSYNEVTITNSAKSRKRAKYPCNHCDKAYTQKCHLYRHLKIHGDKGEPTREFTCEICGKAFIQKCNLKKHLMSHAVEKRFSCDLCPTQCNQKIDMVRHMRMHTGQKPFSCDVCKQKFSRKSNMKLHILTHADSKPFVCHICKSTFSRRYDLNRHNKRKHTGEKPYTCDICDFRSVNASYMKTHIENRHLKEQGAKPYACDVCDFKCANAGYLKIHAQKKHTSAKKKSKKSHIRNAFKS